VQQNRAFTIQEHAVGILADQEADDSFIGKDRIGRDAYRRRSGGYVLLDAARTGELLAHDANHNELNRLPVENFGHFVADDIGIATVLAARALRIRTGDEFERFAPSLKFSEIIIRYDRTAMQVKPIESAPK
jgi:hypothetical protein